MDNKTGIFTDALGGVSYITVEIGNQVWMAENLNIGTLIDSSLNQSDNNLIETYYYHNDSILGTLYGGLYQWDEMMQYESSEGIQGICPQGWHIPTDDQWKILEVTW